MADVGVQDGTVRFEDIDRLVPELFRTWNADGEQRWVRYAWSLWERDGLTAVDSAGGRNEVVVRLIALSALTKGFYVRAFEEGYADDWTDGIAEAVGHPQGIERAWLCEQMRAECVFDDEDSDEGIADDAMEHLMPRLVQEEADEVGSALLRSLGEAELFACLFTSATDGSYPMSKDEVAEIVGSG